MPTGSVIVTVRCKFRWWVRPLLRIARLLVRCRLPVPRDRLAGLIARYGAMTTIVQ